MGSSSTAQPTSRTGNAKDAPSSLHRFVVDAAQSIHRTELLVAILTWFVSLLGGLLALILVDHWVWPISDLFRYGIWMAIVAASGLWFAWRVVPLLGRRINPEYAARRIESNIPEIQDSLISWLQLTLRGDQTPRGVLNTVGRYVAGHLRGQDAVSVVDQFTTIRLVVTLFGIFMIGAIYCAVSPKNGLTSLGRLLMPWANIAPATRVQIELLEPSSGNAVVTEGSFLPIAIQVRGWHQGDTARIRYSTDDGQSIDQVVTMQAEIEGVRYAVDFGKSWGGVVQPLHYWIEVGDASLGPYALRVQAVPLVMLDTVEYHYPKYMKLAPRIVENDGRIDGPEGTRVRLTARSNQPMKRGRIEFDRRSIKEKDFQADSVSDIEINEFSLTSNWFLRLDQNQSNPTLARYRIRTENERNEKNAEPVIYPIKVVPDLPPEVALAPDLPAAIELPVNQTLVLEVRANDPDFGLVRIVLQGAVRGQPLATHDLFHDPDGFLGQTTRTYAFEPQALQLKPGQEVEWIARAEDNRCGVENELPEPNVRQSRPLLIKIVPPSNAQPAPSDSPKNDQTNKNDATKDGPAPPNSEENNLEKNPSPSGSDGNTDASAGNDGKESPGETNSQNASQKGNEEPGNQAQGNQAQGNQAQGNQAQGNQAQGNQAQGNQAQGNQAQGNQAQGNQAQGNQAQGNQAQGNQTQGNPSQGSQAQGGQQQGNPTQANDSKGSQGQGNAASSGNEGSSQTAPKGEGTDRGSQESGSPKGSASGNRGSTDGTASNPLDRANAPDEGESDPNLKQSGQGAKSKGSQNPSGPAKRPEDDGEAFERLQDWLKDQNEGTPSSSSESETSPAKQGAAKSTAGNNPSNSRKGEKGSEPQPPSPNQPQSGNNAEPSSDSSQATGNPSGASSKEKPSPEGPSSASSKGKSNQGEKGKDANSSPANSKSAPSDSSSNSPSEPSASAQGSPDKQESSTSQQGKSAADNPPSPRDAGRPSDAPRTPSENSEKSSGQSGSEGDAGQGGSEAKSGSDTQSGRNPESGSDATAGSGEQTGNGQPSQGARAGKKDASQGKPGPSESSSEAGTGESANGSTGSAGDSPSSNPAGSPSSGGAASKQPTGNLSGKHIDRPDQGNADPTSGQPAAERKAETEYAKEATDLVLRALERQRQQPDPELLKRMGWNQEQFNAFLDRWRAAREQAARDPQAKERYEENLRALGLLPSQVRSSQAGMDDQLRGMNEEGLRIRPPESLRERYEAFRKAANQ